MSLDPNILLELSVTKAGELVAGLVLFLHRAESAMEMASTT